VYSNILDEEEGGEGEDGEKGAFIFVQINEECGSRDLLRFQFWSIVGVMINYLSR